MIKRSLLILSLILGSTTPHLLSFSKSPVISDTNADLYFTSYSSQVSDAVHAILKHPEARKLLQEVTRDGKIRIEVPKSFNASFDAMWDGQNRVIMVNPNKKRTLGNVICSILFELHNASTNKRFLSYVDNAKSGRITKEEFVFSVEKMEHENCMKTIAIIESGIEWDLFPDNTRWKILRNFDDHYKVQQLQGHSGWLADSYNRYNSYGKHMPFYGTVENMQNMSQKDKSDMLRYLALKNSLESKDSQEVARANQELKEEYSKLESSFLGVSSTQGRVQLLYNVFKGNRNFQELTTQPTRL